MGAGTGAGTGLGTGTGAGTGELIGKGMTHVVKCDVFALSMLDENSQMSSPKSTMLDCSTVQLLPGAYDAV